MNIVFLFLGCFQLVQWIWAFARLYADDYSLKSEFLLALIPGMFFFYSLRVIKNMIDKFFELN
jgi:uncharacterized membrane-anchored protein